MKSWATSSRLTASMSGSAEIFRSALARASGHLCEHGKDADKDNRYDHQAHVFVADMRQLVCNDRFQFLVVQLVDDPP